MMMRAVMYYHNNDVRVVELPVPAIGPGELLVKVMASGICGSDVMEWYRIAKAPLVLGHEISAEIVQVGAGVDRYRVGERVFVSHHIPCNTCRYCLHGNHTACETLRSTNYDPGGFAEYVRVPALNVNRGVFPLPPSLSHDEGSCIEPLACAVRGQRLAKLEAGQSVLILGSGIAGMLHLLLAQAMGAGNIMMTDLSAYRLAFARELGAQFTFPATADVPALVREANDGAGADLAIVCTGALPAFSQALAALERGGTVLCYTTPAPGVELPVPMYDFWRNQLRLVTTYGNAPLDAVVAIELIRTHRVPVSRLITHRLPLEDTPLGFRLVAQADASLKVILKPHGLEVQ